VDLQNYSKEGSTQMINEKSLLKALSVYGESGPFDHCVIDLIKKRSDLKAASSIPIN
jgi:hypothetical protein